MSELLRRRKIGLPSAGAKAIGGGVRVCGDVVLRYFWCGVAVIFILTRGNAVSKH